VVVFLFPYWADKCLWISTLFTHTALKKMNCSPLFLLVAKWQQFTVWVKPTCWVQLQEAFQCGSQVSALRIVSSAACFCVRWKKLQIFLNSFCANLGKWQLFLEPLFRIYVICQSSDLFRLFYVVGGMEWVALTFRNVMHLLIEYSETPVFWSFFPCKLSWEI
jgi:hypothetical protein